MDKNAFNNLSILNKMALSLLKVVQPIHKIGLKGIRKKFGWDLIGQLTQLLLFFYDALSEICFMAPAYNKYPFLRPPWALFAVINTPFYIDAFILIDGSKHSQRLTVTGYRYYDWFIIQ